MTTKPRGSRGTTVKQAAIDDAESALQALPEKPKEKLSLKEAVEKLKAPLQAALAKGYSYQELAVMLKENDIIISAATLKNYVPVGKRAAKGQATATKPRRGTKKAEAQDDDAIEEQLSQAASELSAAPDTNNGTAAQAAPSRRGRGSSKAESSTKTKGRGKVSTAESADEPSEGSAKSTSRRRSSAAKSSTGTQRTSKRTSNR